MRRVNWRYGQQNMSFQKWRFDLTLNHFSVKEEHPTEADSCVKISGKEIRIRGLTLLPFRRNSETTNVKKRSSFLLWYSKNKARKDGTAYSRCNRAHSMSGCWGRAAFSLIPRSTAFGIDSHKFIPRQFLLWDPLHWSGARVGSNRKDMLIL